MNNLQTNTYDKKISNILLQMGFMANNVGYQYLKVILSYVINEPKYINCLTKKLYPLTAEQFNATPSSVESAIRHSIAHVWSKNKIENINRIIGIKVFETIYERPSNSEFIALIAEGIRSGII